MDFFKWMELEVILVGGMLCVRIFYLFDRGDFSFFVDVEILIMFFCRWVYLIEGVFSFVCVLVIWFGMFSDVCKVYFLNEEECKVM